MYKDKTYVENVNKTYSKAISPRQALPKFIIGLGWPRESVVLDYGAGTDAYGTRILKTYFDEVVTYDIGNNRDAGIHQVDALESRYYDIIMMSNVINIQPCIDDVVSVLYEVKDCLGYRGRMYCNLPKSPRKSDINERILKVIINGIFDGVRSYKNGTVFEGYKEF